MMELLAAHNIINFLNLRLTTDVSLQFNDSAPPKLQKLNTFANERSILKKLYKGVESCTIIKEKYNKDGYGR